MGFNTLAIRPRTLTLPLIIGGILALGLSGCAPEEVKPTVSPSTATMTTKTGTPSVTPSTSPAPQQLVGVETGYTCQTLLTLEEIFAFNPNYYLSTSPAIQMGNELSTTANNLNGITCDYVSQSDGTPIQLSLVKIESPSMEQVSENLSSLGKTTNAYGSVESVKGFFITDGSEGSINLIIGAYWLSATSQGFIEPTDAEKILIPVVDKLLN